LAEDIELLIAEDKVVRRHAFGIVKFPIDGCAGSSRKIVDEDE
jgi:hypothetical protein